MINIGLGEAGLFNAVTPECHSLSMTDPHPIPKSRTPAQTELNDAFTKVGGDREVGRVGRWRTNWKELGQRDKDDQNILHEMFFN